MKPEDVAAHVTAHFERHPFDPAGLLRSGARASACGRSTCPAGVRREGRRGARGGGSDLQVALRLATDWDKKRFPPARDSSSSRRRRRCAAGQLGEARRRRRRPRRSPDLAVSGKPQDYTVKVVPTFFIDGFDCRGIVRAGVRQSREDARAREGGRLRCGDCAPPTSPIRGSEHPIPKADAEEARDLAARRITRVDARRRGHDSLSRLRARGLATISPGLTATDGQTLGYTWVGCRRELASARVHELRRRSWRLGIGRRRRCCRSTRATF